MQTTILFLFQQATGNRQQPQQASIFSKNFPFLFRACAFLKFASFWNTPTNSIKDLRTQIRFSILACFSVSNFLFTQRSFYCFNPTTPSMASHGTDNSYSFGNKRNDSKYYAPSAPTLPDEDPYSTSTSSAPSSYHQGSSYGQSSTNAAPSSYNHGSAYGQSSAYASPSNYHHGSDYGKSSTNSAPSSYHHGSGYGQSSSSPAPPSYQHGSGYGQNPSNYHHGSGYGQESSYGYPSFPPGTHPDVIRSFQAVDRDRSGFIDENELQQAISSGFQRFNLGTIRLLMFLFKNPSDPLRIGPKEFAALWSCLGEWRGIFERYDRDKSGKIDQLELRDALYGIGYSIPASVLQLLISRYGDGSGRKAELGFDSFVECGVIIKGLTDKFKEKDTRYTGSATLSYETFMSLIIPFLVQYD